MNVGQKPERPTARSLLANAVGADPTTPGIARSLDLAFAQLLVSLGRWVGDDSARVLLDRAIDDTRARHPWLAGVRSSPQAGRCLGGLDDRLVGVTPAQLVAAMEDLLDQLTELLAKFIGNDLALRIVVRGWPAGPPAAQEGDPR